MDKMELQELANKLFMYTDSQDWDRLQSEVFAEEVWYDMSSAGGGEPRALPAKDICDLWKTGFVGLDSVHHQAGHYLIEVMEGEAVIFAYATAFHYKAAAQQGNTRMFVGSYGLRAAKRESGWRLTQFKYNLKFIGGNAALE
jgi:hypothetical protein